MAKPAETVAVESATGDVAKLLDRADDHPLVLERDGRRYTLSREDVGAYYDPEAVRAALTEFAGTLSDDEAARMKELIYRAREEGSRPIEPTPVPTR